MSLRHINFLLLTCCIVLVYYSCKPKNKLDNNPIPTVSWDSIRSSTSYIDFISFMLWESDTTYFDSAWNKYKEFWYPVHENTIYCPPFTPGKVEIAFNRKEQVLFDYNIIELDTFGEYTYHYFHDRFPPDSNKNEYWITHENKEYPNPIVDIVITMPDSAFDIQHFIIPFARGLNRYKKDWVFKWFNSDWSYLPKDEQIFINALFSSRVHLFGYRKYHEIFRPEVVPKPVF